MKIHTTVWWECKHHTQMSEVGVDNIDGTMGMIDDHYQSSIESTVSSVGGAINEKDPGNQFISYVGKYNEYMGSFPDGIFIGYIG